VISYVISRDLNLGNKQGTGAATLRNLNIVQNGKSSKPAFVYVEVKISRLQIRWYLQEDQPFFILGQWNCGFQDSFFEKKQKPNFLTRDILFEMKLSLSSAVSSMYMK